MAAVTIQQSHGNKRRYLWVEGVRLILKANTFHIHPQANPSTPHPRHDDEVEKKG